MDERVLPGLADDQIGPLHDDDGGKESGVAGVLQSLTLVVSLQHITGECKYGQYGEEEIYRPFVSVVTQGIRLGR